MTSCRASSTKLTGLCVCDNFCRARMRGLVICCAPQLEEKQDEVGQNLPQHAVSLPHARSRQHVRPGDDAHVLTGACPCALTGARERRRAPASAPAAHAMSMQASMQTLFRGLFACAGKKDSEHALAQSDMSSRGAAWCFALFCVVSD